MSLFKKGKETPATVPAAAPATNPRIIQTPVTASVNLTDKMLRVEMLEDEATIKYGTIDQNGDNIRIISGEHILVAEIGKRSKAYTELEGKIGKRFHYVVIKAKQGDYGIYYQAKFKFEDSVEIII